MNANKTDKTWNELWLKNINRLRLSIRAHGLPKAIFRALRLGRIYFSQSLYRGLHKKAYQQRLHELEVRISDEKLFLDVLPIPMGWDTELFQRFQHLSLQVSKMGGLALYGGHPSVDRGLFVYREAAQNLLVFDAKDPRVVNCVLRAAERQSQPRLLRIESIDLVTTTEQINDFVQKGYKVVYEYIDEITTDISGGLPDQVKIRHAALLRDERVAIVATSDKLFEEVARFRSKNFILSTNGVDLDHWRIPKREPPKDLLPALSGKTVIGYHGALAKWIDYELLQMIADLGSYEIVLIGREHDPEFRKSGLKSHPRVHFLGSKSYFDLNSYAIYYDIAILPFRKTELTDSVSPVKIFEYMAALKPIVTFDLQECRKYRSCLIAGSRQEFVSQLEAARRLKDDRKYLGILDKEAKENSWKEKELEMLKLTGIKL